MTIVLVLVPLLSFFLFRLLADMVELPPPESWAWTEICCRFSMTAMRTLRCLGGEIVMTGVTTRDMHRTLPGEVNCEVRYCLILLI